MHTLVLLRHGESQWNLENRFTGWTDVELSEKGLQEARHAGELIKKAGLGFDLTYSSVLKRAIRTLWITLDTLDLMWLPQTKSWRLNERHYGALQGLNKAETAEKYGEDQVKIWRRSYDVQPPALEEGDERLPQNDPRYQSFPDCSMPATESLADVIERMVPYWNEEIAPKVKEGRRVLIAAHGNSLRALVKYLDNLSEEEVLELNIPTGQPLVYELDDDLKPIRHYYLDSEESIAAGVQASGVKK